MTQQKLSASKLDKVHFWRSIPLFCDELTVQSMIIT